MLLVKLIKINYKQILVNKISIILKFLKKVNIYDNKKLFLVKEEQNV